MKKAISLVLILCLILSFNVFAENEDEYFPDGTCWSFKDGDTLVISGRGNMSDIVRNGHGYLPWEYIRADVKKIIVEDGITGILDSAFSGFYNLTEVVLANTVTDTGNYTFSSCNSLTEVKFLNKVTHIGHSVFYGCKNLSYVAIPENVKSIGARTFWNCTSLKDIYIPANVEHLDFFMFPKCDSLTEINVDVNNKYYSTLDGNLYNKDGTEFLEYAGGKSEVGFKIPDGVTKIGKHAFFGRNNLKSVEIPDSVKDIEKYAFYECKNLYDIKFPELLESIGSHAFYGCTGLTKISIPSKVEKIDDYTFYECKGLKEIEIPEGIRDIGDFAFYSCKNLTEVILPESLRSIGEKAFGFCENVTVIEIPSVLEKELGSYAFTNCKSLKDLYYAGDIDNWDVISWRAFDLNIKTVVHLNYNPHITYTEYVKNEDNTITFNIKLPRIEIPDNSRLFAAVYNNGKLLNVKSVTVSSDENNIQITLPSEETGTVKILLTENSVSLQPLMSRSEEFSID